MNTSSLGRALRGEIGERLADVLARRAAANPRRIALDLVRQVGDGGVGESALLLRRVDERRRPLVKLRAVLRVALDAGDHEQVRVLRGDRARHRAQAEQRDDAGRQPPRPPSTPRRAARCAGQGGEKPPRARSSPGLGCASVRSVVVVTSNQPPPAAIRPLGAGHRRSAAAGSPACPTGRVPRRPSRRVRCSEIASGSVDDIVRCRSGRRSLPRSAGAAAPASPRRSTRCRPTCDRT